MPHRAFFAVVILLFSQLILGEDTIDKSPTELSTMHRLAERIKMLTDSSASVVEILWLGDGDSQTLALFETPDRGPQQGAVVVLLGTGQLLEQTEYSRSIRRTLAASGWASLIVQTERMDKELDKATLADLSNRLLKEATEQVGAKGYSNIVVVAYGAIAQNIWPTIQSAESSFLGFVGIDEWVTEDFSPSIPVLNVVNRRLPRAINFANKRFSALKKRPSAPCELYFYEGTLGSDVGYGDILGKRIRGWIERHFNNAS